MSAPTWSEALVRIKDDREKRKEVTLAKKYISVLQHEMDFLDGRILALSSDLRDSAKIAIERMTLKRDAIQWALSGAAKVDCGLVDSPRLVKRT